MIDWTEPEIVAGILQSISALIATTVAAWIGKKWLNQEQLKSQLAVAKTDIKFLLMLEKNIYSASDPGLKRKMRMLTHAQGYHWSGKNTLARLE